MTRQLDIGQNTLTVDGDVVHIVRQSVWGLPEVDEIVSLFDELRLAHGRVFVISEAAQGLSVSADGRRRFIAWSRQSVLDGIVMVGAGTVVRVVMTLLVRASELVSGRPWSLHFSPTTSDARQLISQERARLGPPSA